jgi:hypothetical protein
MKPAEPAVPKRRPHNELKSAMRVYLKTLEGKTASIPQIRAGTAQALGDPPQSSYRSALQDERYLQRIGRGIFRLVDESSDEH